MNRFNHIIYICISSLFLYANLYSKVVEFKPIHIPIKFNYPESWGQLYIADYRNSPYKNYYTRRGADLIITFGAVEKEYNGNVMLYFVKYDSIHNNQVICYEDLSDTTDLSKLNKLINRNYDLSQNGYKIKIEEGYFSPNQSLERTYSFFAQNYFIEIVIELNLTLYKHDEEVIKGSNKISRLIEINQSDEALQTLFQDIDKFIKSIDVIDH